jgi:hypothetical protein
LASDLLGADTQIESAGFGVVGAKRRFKTMTLSLLQGLQADKRMEVS